MRQTLSSKLIHVQQHPELVAIVTGGLEHWHQVFENYGSQSTPELARCEIQRLLGQFTEQPNEACCLLCGFVDGCPTCWRINKLRNEPLTISDAPLSDVQPIGMYADEATALAEHLLSEGVNPETALRKTIESILPGRTRVRGPVETFTFYCD